MNIAESLAYLRPGAEWILHGESYDDLQWLDDGDKPTFSECQKAWKEIEQDYVFRPIREHRNKLLMFSDWTQVNDAPVDQKAWAAYRQALRDLPASITDPTEPITWPEPPK
jgi:hypothetical protein